MTHLQVQSVRTEDRTDTRHIIFTVLMPNVPEQYGLAPDGTQVKTLGPDMPHDIEMPAHALEERRMFYGLDTQEQALEAILKEHVQRTHKMSTLGTTPHHILGGLRKDIQVQVAGAHHIMVQDAARDGTAIWRRYIESQQPHG